ncbi:hypothetical protein BGT96224_139, partial [Blumeria graminis f. sp. tritici 96224]
TSIPQNLKLIRMKYSIVRWGPKPNLTGFNPRTLAAAAGSPVNDPWARNEAWRYTGPFSRASRLRNNFPGLGIATVAFIVYCGYEHFFLKNDHESSNLESHA